MGPELVTAGWVASSVVKNLAEMVFSYMKDQKNWQLGMKDELERLQRVLPQIHAVLGAVEMGHIRDPNPKLQEWMWQLRDAVDEAEDVLDELEYHQLEEELIAGKHKLVRNTASRLKEIMLRALQRDPTLKGLRKSVKKLDAVASNVGAFLQLVNRQTKRWKQHHNDLMERRATGSAVSTAAGVVVGREEERDHIIQLLRSNSSCGNPSILPIVGMAGVGKTTLAQYVFNDQRVKDYFQPRIWVCVSDVFDATILTKKMLEDLTGSSPNAQNLVTLQNKLIELLKSKRYLLVLDDVWNDKDSSSWETLFAGLRSGESGSKVLITTRTENVREMMTGMMNTIRLQRLQEDQFLSLFMKCAFGDEDPRSQEKLQKIGTEIARKLKGVPLAAKAVGGLLKGRLDDEYWTSILEDVNSCYKEDGNNVMPILHISYRQLPAQLQSCFSYCSIFPQDYPFRKDDLISMWIAAGLVQQSEKERPEDIGGRYFDGLLKRSFFDIQENSLDGIYYTMHDLLHDLSQSVSEGECLRIAEADNLVGLMPKKTIRHLYVETDSVDVIKKISELMHLRTLVLSLKTIPGEEHITTCKKELKRLTTLRVLRLSIPLEWPRSSFRTPVHYPSDISADEFFQFLGNLIHLRYLDLRKSHISTLPKSLYRLHHLQVLVASSSASVARGVCNLINLRRLNLPMDEIAGVGKLTSLNYLNGFHVQNKRGYTIEELGDMNELRELRISGLWNIKSAEEASKAKLKEKQYLRSLELQFWEDSNQSVDLVEQVLDRLEPHHNKLKKLEITRYAGVRSPTWMENPSLTNLESIHLMSCKKWKHLPPFGKLPYLKILRLETMASLEVFDGGIHDQEGGGIVMFPQLQQLHISDVPAFTRWSSPSTSSNSHCQWFPHLKRILLWNCPHLGELPRGLCHSITLEEMSIRCCWLLKHDFVAGDLCSLKSLDLYSCPKMANLLLPSSLEKLTISGCELDDESVLLRSLNGGLTSLSSLHIQGSVVYPEYEQVTSLPTAEVMGQLCSLRELHIDAFPKLTLSGLGGLQALPSLRTLGLVSLPEVLSIPPLPSSLQSLAVSCCHEELAERCTEDGGEDWPKIAHIPHKSFNQYYSYFMSQMNPVLDGSSCQHN